MGAGRGALGQSIAVAFPGADVTMVERSSVRRKVTTQFPATPPTLCRSQQTSVSAFFRASGDPRGEEGRAKGRLRDQRLFVHEANGEVELVALS